MSSSADVLMTPTRTMVSARPGAPSTTPTPHLVSPGSTPSTRIGCRAYRRRARYDRWPARAHRRRRPGAAGRVTRSSRVTIAVTWSLPARPLPVTAALTSLGVCRATGSPRRAAQTIATAPACAVPITVRTFCWLNTRSTATASGRHASSQASISVSIASSRAAMSSSADVLMTPTRTRVSARPGAPSTTPTPHLVSPGSTPSTRTGCRAYDKPTRCSPYSGPRTSVRVELTGPRAVRSRTGAACRRVRQKPSSMNGVAANAPSRAASASGLPPSARPARRRVATGVPAYSAARPRAPSASGAWPEGEGRRGRRTGVRSVPGKAAFAGPDRQVPPARVGRPQVIGDLQRYGEVRRGEAAGGDGGGRVEQAEHPALPFGDVRVLLAQHPPERIGRADLRAYRLGHRGVGRGHRPQRPGGRGRGRPPPAR